MDNKKVRVTYGDKTAEFPFPVDYISFLKACSIELSIPKEEIQQLNSCYQDEEGDSVLVNSEFDYDQAHKVMEETNIDILIFTLEPKINQSMSMILKEAQSPIIDSMRSGQIFEPSSIEGEKEINTESNLEIQNEVLENEEKRKQLMEEIEKSKREQEEEENNQKMKIKQRIEEVKKQKELVDRHKREQDAKEEERRKEEEERLERLKREEEEKRIREENERKEKEEIARKKKEEEERRIKEAEKLEREKALQEEMERINKASIEEIKKKEEEAKQQKAVDTYIKMLRMDKVLKLLKKNYIVNKKAEKLASISKIAKKQLEREALGTLKSLPPKQRIEDTEEYKQKLLRKKRILEKLNQKARESVIQSRIAQSAVPNKMNVNNNILDELNPKDYENTLQSINMDAQKAIQEKMTKYIEEEYEKMKKQLIEKTLKQNQEIINTYINQLSTIDKERQNVFQNEMSKVIQQSQSQIKNNNMSMSVSSIHSNIKCELCLQQPIVGIRYKCSICPNYNLCESCEEKNYELKTHPHDFIRMRDPVVEKPKVIPQNGGYQLLEPEDKNINQKFSFDVLNKNLTYNINQGKEKFLDVRIVLQNNYGMSWNLGTTKLVCDKLRSNIICEDVNLPPLSSEQKTEVRCLFNNVNTLEPGNYKCYFNFTVDKKIYGPPIVILVNILKQSFSTGIQLNIDLFRKKYDLPVNDYSDEKLKNVLIQNNMDYSQAFAALFS